MQGFVFRDEGFRCRVSGSASRYARTEEPRAMIKPMDQAQLNYERVLTSIARFGKCQVYNIGLRLWNQGLGNS